MEAAARRNRVERRFAGTIESRGYAEVMLPILDYVDAYPDLAGFDNVRRAYRFVDRDGELVTLRSDFTPMLARALAPTITGAELPLRVFYRGDVIRCDGSRLGANREMFQIGAEIIGDGSTGADVEILNLAADLAPDATVVYTDTSLVAALSAASPAVGAALQTKRSAGDPLASKILDGNATLDDVRGLAPDQTARLETLQAALDSRFIFHVAEADEAAAYYTGIRFAVYSGRAHTRVAQGGRYDDLYERFGTAAPAVGFTFTIDDLD